MITNTSAERVNYRSDTRDVCAIKVTSHCVFAWILIAPFICFPLNFSTVHQHQLFLLLAAAMATALDTSHSLASERSSIESTYELTKYLEYQLKEIKDIYVSPFCVGRSFIEKKEKKKHTFNIFRISMYQNKVNNQDNVKQVYSFIVSFSMLFSRPVHNFIVFVLSHSSYSVSFGEKESPQFTTCSTLYSKRTHSGA